MKQARVNVSVLVNNKKIRYERRNGRDIIVVPSATLPDDVVMNRIKYPSEEIEKGFGSLNRTPAPLGHPTYNGEWISARDPEALNMAYIGAWNENVRRENGRVFLDKMIDVEVAKRSTGGQALLDAIKNGDPIHTSTGLLCMLEEAKEDDYDFIAHDMEFDHDAILMGEQGAATPEQGVGMLVNQSSDKIPVINSVLEYAEQELDWAGLRLVEALDRAEKASVWERVKTAILEAMKPAERGKETEKGFDMNVTKEMFDALEGKVNAIASQLDSNALGKVIADAVSNAVKPLTQELEAAQAARNSAEETKKNELVNMVVKANLLTEDVAKTMPMPALEELANKVKPRQAAPVNGAYNGGNTKASYKLPEGD